MAKLLSGTRIYGTGTVDTQLFVSGTNAASSTLTGALQVIGGVGIGGALYANTLNATTSSYIGGAQIVTTGTIGTFAFNGGTITNPLIINSITNAISTITGALQIVGGAGIGKDVWVGGAVYGNIITSNINVSSPTALSIGGTVNLSTVTNSLSTITGALVISGGVGVGKDAFIGGSTYITSTATIQSAAASSTSISGNALAVTGGIGAASLYLSTNGYINGAQIITSATLNSFSGGIINSSLTINTITNATSTNSGAFQVVGGVGIGKDLWVGGAAYIQGDLYVDGTQTIVDSTAITTKDKLIYISNTATAGLANGAGIVIGTSGTTHVSLLYSNANSTNSWASNGNIVPSTAGGYDLGIAANQWRNVYANSGRIIGGVNATNTQSGSLQVVGGAGIGQNLVVGSSATVLSSAFDLTNVTGNAIYTPGGIGSAYLTVTGNAYVNGSQVLTQANIAGLQYNGGVVNNAIVINSTTNATSTSTGSVVTTGGLGVGLDAWIGGKLNVGSAAFSTSTIAGNALAVTGGIGASSLYLSGNAYINGAQVITSATINQFSGGTINAALVINDSTQAVSTNTGALQIVNGGIGVGGNVISGGRIYANTGQASIGSTGTNNGALVVNGGAGISQNLIVGNYLGVNTGVAGPQVALEINGTGIFGAANATRTQIISTATQVFNSSELNPRVSTGRDQIASNVSGVGFMLAGQTMQSGGAGVGAVSGNTGWLGLYTTDLTSQQIRVQVDTTGNMLIGGTAGRSANATLDVAGNARFTLANGSNIFNSGNVANRADLQVTRTLTGNSADFRIGVAGAFGDILAGVTNQGDAALTVNQTLHLAVANTAVGKLTSTQLVINHSTAASSTASGALQITGGTGMGGNLWVGGTANIAGTTTITAGAASTATSGTNALIVTGGIYAESINLKTVGTINGSVILTAATVGAAIGSFNGGTITSPLVIQNSTVSANTGTGALQVLGGVGIGNNLYVGGGAVVGGILQASGVTTINNATAASNTTTGALQIVNGGAGIGGSVFAGGTGTFVTGVYDGSTRVINTVSPSAGTGISLGTVTTASGVVTFTISNSGVTSLTAGTDITVNAGAGPVTGGVTVATNSTLQSVTGRGATTSVIMTITNATAATSTTTGALQVTGGVGIQGDLYARNIYMSGTLVGTGSGGGSSTSTPYINVTSATVALSTLSGALIVTGGAGIGKDLIVGGPVAVGIGKYLSSGAAIQTSGSIESLGVHVGSNLYAQTGNLLVQTSNYTTNWTQNNVSVNAATAVAPDGTTTGNFLNEGTTANGLHNVTQSGLSPAGPVTFSAFLAAGPTRTAGLLNIVTNGANHSAWFNLSTGVMTGTTASPTYPITARIEPIAYNQGAPVWYRCSITVWAPTSVTTSAVGIYNLATPTASVYALTDASVTYAGVAGAGIYAWGAQFETGYYPGNYNARTTTNDTSVASLYSGGSLYVANTGTVGGSPIITAATLMTSINGSMGSGNTLRITNTTNASATGTGALIVDGGVGIAKDVYIGGTLYATAKSFLINHPTKEGYKLQYASLEGPENGVYVRGRLSNAKVIELPEHWTGLVDESTITVDLTPIGKHQKLYVEKIEDNKVYVNIDGLLLAGKIDCFYTVYGERKDIDKLKTEYKG
jgi:hypothetical protein